MSQFSPLFEVFRIDFKMLPGDVLEQSGNTHFASSQPADKLVQPVTYLTAYEHGLAVFDSRDLKKGFPVFVQRKFPLPAAYTTLGRGNGSSFPVGGCRISDGVSVCSTVPSDFSFPVSFKDDSRAVSMPPSDGSMNDMSVPVMASHSSLVNFFFVTIHF